MFDGLFDFIFEVALLIGPNDESSDDDEKEDEDDC